MVLRWTPTFPSKGTEYHLRYQAYSPHPRILCRILVSSWRRWILQARAKRGSTTPAHAHHTHHKKKTISRSLSTILFSLSLWLSICLSAPLIHQGIIPYNSSHIPHHPTQTRQASRLSASKLPASQPKTSRTIKSEPFPMLSSRKKQTMVSIQSQRVPPLYAVYNKSR